MGLPLEPSAIVDWLALREKSPGRIEGLERHFPRKVVNSSMKMLYYSAIKSAEQLIAVSTFVFRKVYPRQFEKTYRLPIRPGKRTVSSDYLCGKKSLASFLDRFGALLARGFLLEFCKALLLIFLEFVQGHDAPFRPLGRHPLCARNIHAKCRIRLASKVKKKLPNCLRARGRPNAGARGHETKTRGSTEGAQDVRSLNNHAKGRGQAAIIQRSKRTPPHTREGGP